jgi:hypothetical protein
LGVAGYLPKPIRGSELRDAILSALRDAPEQQRPTLITRHSVREARHSGRILLVEDSKVNQMVATHLLGNAGTSS